MNAPTPAAAPETREAVIEVEHLTSRFGRQVVHNDIDLVVFRDEVLALVGGSGSGKTTLVRQMLGLERPAEGHVRVFGVDLVSGGKDELAAMRSRWGMLFQNGALFSALSVFDNIALPLRELKQLEAEVIHDLVMMKLEMVGIEPRHANKKPSELSGGMVKRIALARAIALDPELLFLDEPTAGLDPDRSESFVRLIQALRSELRMTVVMVTHDLDTLVALADRVAVLARTRLVAVDTLAEITKLDDPFVCNFFCGERGQRAMLARSGTGSAAGA
ncbi:MAG: ATP-binding cassette domain-containing protein [Proteobacteria bacterium]|nr:ATP-binding cassette domain-containing protein [Burkholderiales bacterium]